MLAEPECVGALSWALTLQLLTSIPKCTPGPGFRPALGSVLSGRLTSGQLGQHLSSPRHPCLPSGLHTPGLLWEGGALGCGSHNGLEARQ